MNRRLKMTMVQLGVVLGWLFLPEPGHPTSSVLGTSAAMAQSSTFLQFSGGPVLGKRAFTHTGTTLITRPAEQFPSTWVTLPDSLPLNWKVTNGPNDLFNVTFSAECAFVEEGGFAEHRIRILDTTTGLIMHPYEEISLTPAGREFCTVSTTNRATHTGVWARRMNQGQHNLVVQFLVAGGTVAVKDWTFELVVYD